MNTNFTFVFDIIPSESELVKQSEYFADFFLSKNLFTNKFDYVTRNQMQRRKALSEAYQYSYIKSVFYSVSLFDSRFVQIPSESFVFSGHAHLFNCIANGYSSIPYLGTKRSSVNLCFDVDSDEIISKLQSFSLFKECAKYSSKGNFVTTIMNPELESMLSFLNKTYPEVLSLSKISQNSPDNFKGDLSSLGNGYYSEDFITFNYIESEETSVDLVSTFWSHANFIIGKDIPYVDPDDAVYDTILTENIDVATLQFDVEAITGFKPFGYYDTDNNSNPSKIINDDGFGPDSGSISDGGINKRNAKGLNNRRKPKRSTSITKDNSNSKLGNKPNKIVSLSRKAANGINSLIRDNKYLTEDNIGVARMVISDIIGHNIKASLLRNYIGSTINRALEDFKVTIDNRVINDNKYYNSYEIEKKGDVSLVLGIAPR